MAGKGHGWQTIPLVNERLFLFAPRGALDVPDGSTLSVSQFAHLPLGVTSRAHGLRLWVDAAFERAGLVPKIAVEVDGAITLLDIARTHRIATIQPGAAIDCLRHDDMQVYPMADPLMFRRHVVTSAPDDELSPPALAARLVLVELMRSLVTEGRWPGATLHEP